MILFETDDRLSRLFRNFKANPGDEDSIRSFMAAWARGEYDTEQSRKKHAPPPFKSGNISKNVNILRTTQQPYPGWQMHGREQLEPIQVSLDWDLNTGLVFEGALEIARNLIRAEGYEVGEWESHEDDYDEDIHDFEVYDIGNRRYAIGNLDVNNDLIEHLSNTGYFSYSNNNKSVTISAEWPI